MNFIKTFVAVSALSLFLCCQLCSERQRHCLHAGRAEAKIAAQAAEQGASYKITSAQFNNRVHMTAELSK